MSTTKIEIFGVKEAIKELKTVDPEMRKSINTKAKELATPVTNAAKQNYPTRYLSGMARKWTVKGRALFPYDQAAAQKGVVLKIDTSKRNQGLIVIIQKNPAAAITDMAGKKGGAGARGGAFVNNMMAFGLPSRVMWPAYEHNKTAVEQGFKELINDVMAKVNKRVIEQ